MSYTYAVLDVSPAAYREIRAALNEVGRFGHDEEVFDYVGGSEIIRMGEFALKAKPEPVIDLGITPEEESELREEALKGFADVLARMMVRWVKLQAAKEVSTE